MKNMWINACNQELKFYENGDIVTLRVNLTKCGPKGIITNVPHITKIPSSPILRHLAEELNESYEVIKNIKEHLEEIKL